MIKTFYYKLTKIKITRSLSLITNFIYGILYQLKKLIRKFQAIARMGKTLSTCQTESEFDDILSIKKIKKRMSSVSLCSKMTNDTDNDSSWTQINITKSKSPSNQNDTADVITVLPTIQIKQKALKFAQKEYKIKHCIDINNPSEIYFGIENYYDLSSEELIEYNNFKLSVNRMKRNKRVYNFEK